MASSLIEYAIALPSDGVGILWLEEAAYCAAWAGMCAGDPAEQGRCERIRALLEAWCEGPDNRPLTTEGRHQQPLLRKLIDLLQERGSEELADDEVHFLHAAYELAGRARNRSLFDRPRALLASHAEVLAARRAASPLRPGMPFLKGRIRYASAADLERARPREIRTFAGIEVGCVAPVFTHGGDLKILDNVPEQCVVVVDGGSCWIGGYLLGRVAATEACEVFENISGMAVVRQGEVRARNIINGAYIVAKSGDVACKQVQNPRLIFSGNRLSVHGDVFQGRLVAPRIGVRGTVHAGELHVSESLDAEALKPASGRTVSVVLRRELGGKDYGEVVGPEAQQLIARAASTRFRIRQLVLAVQVSEAEGEAAALNALLYLCCGEDARARLEALETRQRRLAYLRRVIAGLQEIGAYTESGGSGEAHEVFPHMVQELQQVESEGAPDADLQQEHREILDTWRELVERERTTGMTSVMLARLRERLSSWVREHRLLTEEVRREESELRALSESLAILKQTEKSRSRVQLLRRFLRAAKERGPADPVARRAESPFVNLMLRIVENRLERAARYRSLLEEQRGRLRNLAEILRRDHQVVIAEEKERPADARATGRFSAGVRILAEPPPPSPDPSEWPYTTSGDAADRITTYVRTDDGIRVREEAEAAAVARASR
jgi:hypothetical protein